MKYTTFFMMKIKTLFYDEVYGSWTISDIRYRLRQQMLDINL